MRLFEWFSHIVHQEDLRENETWFFALLFHQHCYFWWAFCDQDWWLNHVTKLDWKPARHDLWLSQGNAWSSTRRLSSLRVCMCVFVTNQSSLCVRSHVILMNSRHKTKILVKVSCWMWLTLANERKNKKKAIFWIWNSI